MSKTAQRVPKEAASKKAAAVKTPSKLPVKASAKAPAKTPVKTPVKTAKASPVNPKAKLAKSATAKPAKAVTPASKAAAQPAPKPVVVAKTAQVKTKAADSKAPKSTKAAPATKAPVVPKPVSAALSSARQTPAPAPVYRSSRPEPPIQMSQTATAVKIDPKIANAWKTKAGRDLTDAELLAMPDSEYMNEKQLEFFKAKLDHLKDDLLSNAGETTEHLREDTSIVPDPADRATIEEEHALELRTRDRERKLLKKISQALVRIDSGEYGYCDETGEPIGLGRLIARPTATLSLEAQQRRELKQKLFGD